VPPSVDVVPPRDATTTTSRSARRSTSSNLSTNVRRLPSENAGRLNTKNARPDQSAIAERTVSPSDTNLAFQLTLESSDKNVFPHVIPNGPRDVP
jgi:hypothetical protein